MDVKMATCQQLNLEDLRYNATKFAKKSWNSKCSNNAWSIGRINKIEFNPGLLNGCPAIEKYCKCCRRLDASGVDIDTFFAWHGTPELRNIASICYHGFSPSTRKRQVHGKGEYFGVVAEDSHNYSGNTDHLIVVQIINCEYVRTLPNCHVVNNPQHQKYTFTLPVLVITYNNTAPLSIPWIQSPQIPKTSTFPSLQQNSSTVDLCWHWTKDSGALEPFDISTNKIIEHNYQNYLKRGATVFTTSPIKRYCGTTYQQYIIDFSTMTQENNRTRFKRCIQRCIPAIPQWHWMEDDNVAVPFPKVLNNLIEKQYTEFVSQPNGINATFTTPSISRKNDNAQQVYQIDFKRMRQTNCNTLYERNVTRVMPSPSSATTTSFQTGKVLPVNYLASSWKWFWITDDGNSEPYPDSVRDVIEQHFQLYAHGGPCFFHVSGIARKCDNAIQSYTIDFRPPMTQTNQATGYQRNLTRVMAALPSSTTTSFQTLTTHTNHATGRQHKLVRKLSIKPNEDFSSASARAHCQWYWIKDDGSPEPYSRYNNKLIEHHYKLCTSGGPRSFELAGIIRKCDNATQSYIINFDMPMTQVNQKTGYIRQLMRSTKAQSGSSIQQSNYVPKVQPKGGDKWKWYWIKDDGHPEPYIDYISDLIEYNYQRHVKGGPTYFQTPEITRQHDGVRQSYIIKFSTPATQIHCMTGHMRKLMRLLQTQSISTVHPSDINNVYMVSPAKSNASVWKWLWETGIRSPDTTDTIDNSEIQKPSSPHTCTKKSANSSILEGNKNKSDSGINDMHFHQNSDDLATNSVTSLPDSEKRPQEYSAASSNDHQRYSINEVGNSAAATTTPAQETKSSSYFFTKWFSPIVAEINTFFWGSISDGAIDIDTAEAT